MGDEMMENPNVGRKHAKNPLSEVVSARVDKATGKALDAEIAVEEAARPGIPLSRGDMVRVLVLEALATRAKKRGK
jgi:hypothetical protein